MDCQGAWNQKEGRKKKGNLAIIRKIPQTLSFFPGPSDIPSGFELPGNPLKYLNPSRYHYIEVQAPEGPWKPWELLENLSEGLTRGEARNYRELRKSKKEGQEFQGSLGRAREGQEFQET